MKNIAKKVWTNPVFVRVVISFLVVTVVTTGSPTVKVWMDQCVTAGNAWFAGLAPWANTAVQAVAKVLGPVYKWVPNLMHSLVVAFVVWLAWALLKKVVHAFEGNSQPRPQRPQRQRRQQTPPPQNP